MFNRKLSIHVPSTYGENLPADIDRVNMTKDSVHKALCNLYGGSTEIASLGQWVNDNGDIVAEPVAICFALIDSKISNKSVNEVAVMLSSYVQKEMQQTCVLWVIEVIQGDLVYA